jgi:hypothetical protein
MQPPPAALNSDVIHGLTYVDVPIGSRRDGNTPLPQAAVVVLQEVHIEASVPCIP